MVTDTASHLAVDLFGTYTPGPAFAGLTPTPAEVALAFTQAGSTISASFTVSAVPEPASMVTMGIGLCGVVLRLRRRLRHE